MKLITTPNPEPTPYDILKELFPETPATGVVGEPAKLEIVKTEEEK